VGLNSGQYVLPITNSIYSVTHILFQFGGTILATVFEEQLEKWEPLVLSRTSKAIALVYDYIFELLVKLCPEMEVRDQLWDALLVDQLRDACRRAMSHARFLLSIEGGGRPLTFNHYFNATLQQKRSERICQSLETLAVSFSNIVEKYVPVNKLHGHAIDKENGQQCGGHDTVQKAIADL
jgi:hypothetical protein